jgi:hypothetical protein
MQVVDVGAARCEDEIVLCQSVEKPPRPVSSIPWIVSEVIASPDP